MKHIKSIQQQLNMGYVGMLLVFVITLLSTLTFTSAKTYYVTPNTSTSCPEEGVPCHTLSQYATKSSEYFGPFSTSTLVLLAGNHTLDSEFVIPKFAANLSIVTTSESETVISCKPSARFTSKLSGVVIMRGLVLLGCVNNNFSTVFHLIVEDCSFQGLPGCQGTGLELRTVAHANIVRSSFSSNTGRAGIVKNTGTGEVDSSPRGLGGALFVVNCGNLTISNCTFTNNTVPLMKSGEGGALLAEHSILTIESSTFTDNIVYAKSNGEGGALFIADCTVIINSSVFVNNTAISYTGQGGAVSIVNSDITVSASTFANNTAFGYIGLGGAMTAGISCMVTLKGCTFTNNTVAKLNGYKDSFVPGPTVTVKGLACGAVSIGEKSNITVISTVFTANTVTDTVDSAVYILQLHDSGIDNIMTVNRSTSDFTNGTVSNQGSGGAMCVLFYSTATILSSKFVNNTVATSNIGPYSLAGGVSVIMSNITIANSTFTRNTVQSGLGGAIFAGYSRLTMNGCIFANNSATGSDAQGGAIYFVGREVKASPPFYTGSITPLLTLSNSTFTNNTAENGGALYTRQVNLNSSGFLDIQFNTAKTGALYAVHSTLYLSGSTTISNNYGALFAFSCNVTFDGRTNITNNAFLYDTSQEGGAVTGIQSQIILTGTANLRNNTAAVHGGGISATESEIFLYGNVSIADNKVTSSGGGIYAFQSELNIAGKLGITGNRALETGGGIHAISSSTKLTDGSKTFVVANRAKRGGGMCLESNSILYIIKEQPECPGSDTGVVQSLCAHNPETWVRLEFTGNSADYGGALYITDNTNSGTCNDTSFNDQFTVSGECFFQALAAYLDMPSLRQFDYSELNININNTFFANNTATVAGNALHGGLLDRCSVSAFTEYSDKIKYQNLTENFSVSSYLLNITDLEIQDFNTTDMISSDPVRVCFCKDNQPDCSYHPPTVLVRKGESFKVSLVAVDQINNTISNSTIHGSSSLNVNSKLGEGSIQQTNADGSCTELEYRLLSPNSSEELHLYAEGPCMGIGISTASLSVKFRPCPVGFIDTNNNLCDCDPILSYQKFVSNCSIDIESVQRKGDAWFSYVNNTDHEQSYVYHRHCPFDYCILPMEEVFVNLNDPNGSGADILCAFNRSGKLCGSCEDGLSLSLGSSRCMSCSNVWIALLIVFTIAGIALIAFLLTCNLTVAVGTINGLIFYANIFAANRAVFFPFDKSNVLTIFIAWLNLDLGFHTCFIDGMDTYIKTWFQLAFPIYVIASVVAIIVISDYSPRFASLFTGKNPVATLATLILLSYTKLLRTIITILSFTTLEYSDGSREVVWLADGNVPYLKGKHIPLFITALAIIVAGTLYTSLLLCWQCLVHCPSRGPLKWILANSKHIAFMDAYHNPFNARHRYWIGLLLLIRVLLYLVSAVNVLGDPRINLLSINSAIVTLLFFQRAVEYKQRIHKKWFTDAFQSISCFNLVGLSSVTYFITEDTKSQAVVAHVSIGITFVMFLATLAYHAYTFVFKKRFQKSRKFLNINVIQRLARQGPVPETNAAIPENELVTVTEYDGFPEAVDTLTDDMVTLDSEEEDTETVEDELGPTKETTEQNTEGAVANSPAALAKDEDEDVNINIDILKVELRNLVSGSEPMITTNYKGDTQLLQSTVAIPDPVVAEEGDDDHFSAGDETTPLLSHV